MKKFAIIIDTYPSNEVQKDRLLKNLKCLKDEGIDVMVTSHHPCNEEIIENSTFFLFEKTNKYYFLDSDILNENIKGIKDPVYLKYTTIGNEVFHDRLVITGWSVAITSQMFSAMKFLYSKGYDYAFYMVDDFLCPENIREKIDSIFEKSSDKRNYFVKNKPLFSSWYAGCFFGFTIDQHLINKLPNLDFSDNKVYQKYFPNCAGEDMLLRIFENDDNYIDEHVGLDNFFGQGNWNLNSSVIQQGASQLQNSTSSSVFINSESNSSKYCLMLYTSYDCPHESVTFKINIKNTVGKDLYNLEISLARGQWFKDYIDYCLVDERVVLNKQLISSDQSCSLEDTILIDKKDLASYSILKNFKSLNNPNNE